MLLILAVVMLLLMLRLGVWQLDRAEQKQVLLTTLLSKTGKPPVPLIDLNSSEEDLRYTNVTVTGQFIANKSLLVDRQVVDGQVGYLVMTPLRVENSDTVILISRGWVSAGQSREQLPAVMTPQETLSLTGRLNHPPAEPPLWDDKYPVSEGEVWQFLPINKVAQELALPLFPLVLELAPETPAPVALRIQWPAINDQWVAKHQGYAFQWFAMAAAFCIACLVVLVRRNKMINR